MEVKVWFDNIRCSERSQSLRIEISYLKSFKAVLSDFFLDICSSQVCLSCSLAGKENHSLVTIEMVLIPQINWGTESTSSRRSTIHAYLILLWYNLLHFAYTLFFTNWTFVATAWWVNSLVSFFQVCFLTLYLCHLLIVLIIFQIFRYYFCYSDL